MNCVLLASTLLPHLDALDCHSTIGAFTPRWQPLIRSIVKCPLSIFGSVYPWLVVDIISEPSVSASDRDVQD